jgi:hypothetical protein
MSLLEYGFARTAKKETLVLDLSEDHARNQQILWVRDVWASIQALTDPMTLEQIIQATNSAIGEKRSEMEVIIAIGGLLADGYLVLADL